MNAKDRCVVVAVKGPHGPQIRMVSLSDARILKQDGVLVPPNKQKPGNSNGRSGHFVKQAGPEVPVVLDDVKLKNALGKNKLNPESIYDLAEIGRFGC